MTASRLPRAIRAQPGAPLRAAISPKPVREPEPRAAAAPLRVAAAAPQPDPRHAELPIRHITSTKIVALRGTELEVRDDLVVGEEPLEIRAAGPLQEPVSVAVTMRTPGHEEELAIGFMTSEGLPFIDRAVILSLPEKLRAAQSAFDRTGGLHAGGLFETDGRLVLVREDVGRHNALDKIIGSRARAHELPLWDRILMVSGRVSFEIVQKAAVAGVPIICAVSAPSDLAVRLAERLGVTLIGFLRGDGFNVYANDGRIDLRAFTR